MSIQAMAWALKAAGGLTHAEARPARAIANYAGREWALLALAGDAWAKHAEMSGAGAVRESLKSS
jgi:hypothetical protein